MFVATKDYESRYKFWFYNDSVIRHTGAAQGGNYHLIGGGEYMVFKGNDFTNTGENFHNFRVAGVNHFLFQDNTSWRRQSGGLSTNSLSYRASYDTSDPNQMRRSHSSYGLVQGNHWNATAHFQPQNVTSDETVRYVVVERNVHRPEPVNGYILNDMAYGFDTKDIVFRNNAIFQTLDAFRHSGLTMATSERVHIYNNSFYSTLPNATFLAPPPNDKTPGGYDPETIYVRGNIAHLTASDADFVDGLENVQLSENWAYTPARTVECRDPGGGTSCVNPVQGADPAWPQNSVDSDTR